MATKPKKRKRAAIGQSKIGGQTFDSTTGRPSSGSKTFGIGKPRPSTAKDREVTGHSMVKVTRTAGDTPEQIKKRQESKSRREASQIIESGGRKAKSQEKGIENTQAPVDIPEAASLDVKRGAVRGAGEFGEALLGSINKPGQYTIAGQLEGKYPALAGAREGATVAQGGLAVAGAAAAGGMALGLGIAAVTTLGIGTATAIMGLSSAMVWLASDNIMTGLSMHATTAVRAVREGEMPPEQALTLVEEAQVDKNYTEGLIKQQVNRNPMLWPFGKFILLNAKVAQGTIDGARDTIENIDYNAILQEKAFFDQTQKEKLGVT